MSPEYMAPARFVLTVLHIRDSSSSALTEGPGQEATYGTTVCGQPLLASELWMLVEREPGDRVCARCMGTDLSEEQGSLL